ncbi:hypothetical protein MKW92_032925 [Papaver armeniacum]|nr:hypothetical protein MKW92_032925 [Papaver armeniacum]
MNYVRLKIIQAYQPNFKLAQKISDKIFQQTQKSHSRYIKLGISLAESDLFDETPDWDIVSATKVIDQFVKKDRHKDAISLFSSLLIFNCTPTQYTFGTVIHSSITLQNLCIGEQFHACALKLNSVTLLCVLLACDHTGLVNEDFTHSNLAKAEDPNMRKPEHYACMVDLIFRGGRFRIGFWKSLLGGCQIHSNLELADYAARRIHFLDPKDSTPYVMIFNANSADGRWSNSSVIRTEMKEKGMTIIPGCSWIEANGKVHVFVTSDKRHVQKDEIYLMLRNLLVHMKVDHDIRNTEKP